MTAAGFNLDLANVVGYAEWTQRTTTDTLSQAFGDTEAYYATIGYRFGKWLPHLTFASIDGEASTVGLTRQWCCNSCNWYSATGLSSLTSLCLSKHRLPQVFVMK